MNCITAKNNKKQNSKNYKISLVPFDRRMDGGEGERGRGGEGERGRGERERGERGRGGRGGEGERGRGEAW